jgi:hypothetical protein
MAKQILDDIKLFPWQEDILEQIESDSETIKQLLTLWENGILSRQELIDYMPSVFSPPENVTTATNTPVEPLTVQHLQAALPLLNPQLTEVQPITEELEQQGYSQSEIMNSGMVYAPYIPLYTTPTVNISELKAHRFYTGWKQACYKVPKYDDIYSDISKRFEILDL